MKRDIDLLRHLLLNAEDPEYINTPEGRTNAEAFSEKYGKNYIQVRNEHVRLLAESGLIEMKGSGATTPSNIARIKHFGYEFIEHIRDYTRWVIVKREAESISDSSLCSIMEISIKLSAVALHNVLPETAKR